MALGCGSYDVWLMNRGATRMLKQLPFTSLEWNRNIDDVSIANVQLAGIQGKKGSFCCDDADVITPWEHEIGIYRNSQRVWAGPVINKGSTDVGYAVNCRDIMTWTKRRRVHRNYTWVAADVALIFNAIVHDAVRVDNSMGLVTSATPSGISGDRRVLAAQYKLAWPILEELSRTGVDWTVIDRNVIIGNFELNLTPIATLTDGAFVKVGNYQVDGAELVTDAVTVGDGFGEAGATVVGQHRGGDTARFGVHEMVYTESGIRDNNSAKRNARSRWDLNHEPAQLFDGGDLSQEAEIEVTELIPGRAIRLMLNEVICDTFYGTHRIAAVTGSAGPEHERISLRVQPLGTASSTL